MNEIREENVATVEEKINEDDMKHRSMIERPIWPNPENKVTPKTGGRLWWDW